jgi:hypothetical protein
MPESSQMMTGIAVWNRHPGSGEVGCDRASYLLGAKRGNHRVIGDAPDIRLWILEIPIMASGVATRVPSLLR